MSFKVESATAAQGTAVTAAGPGRRPGYFVKSANSSILWLIDPGRPRMTRWPPPSIASKVWRAKLLAKLPSARQGDLAVRRPPKEQVSHWLASTCPICVRRVHRRLHGGRLQLHILAAALPPSGTPVFPCPNS